MSTPLTPEEMDSIQVKLINIYVELKDFEGLTRVLFYLNEIDQQYRMRRVPTTPQVWRTLHLTLHSDEVFKQFADRLLEDTKRAEIDTSFKATMQTLYENLMDPSSIPYPDKEQQGFDQEKETRLIKRSQFSVALGLVGVISDDILNSICRFIPKLSCQTVASAADEVVGIFSSTLGQLVLVGLSAVFLCWEAYAAISDWLNGKISGKRAGKQFINGAARIVGGAVVGSIAGAAVGAIAGPIGFVLGGIAGGLGAAKLFEYLMDYFTQKVFGIPREVALENAYKFFDVGMNASSDEINAAFRRKCLETHPDKGGRGEEFLLVQIHMTAIRELRGKPVMFWEWTGQHGFGTLKKGPVKAIM